MTVINAGFLSFPSPNGTTVAGWTMLCIVGAATANATGKITSINIHVATDMSGIKVGSFFNTGGSNWTCRDFSSVPDKAAGLHNNVPVDFDITAGDHLGIYWTGGTLQRTNGLGTQCRIINADGTGGSNNYGSVSNITILINATGSDVVGPANLKSLNTNVSANIKSYNTNPLANIKSINTNA